MSDNIIVAIISLIGSFAGSFGALIAANKLMQYRIEKLEEADKEFEKLIPKVNELDKHNAIQDEQIKNLEDEQERIIEDIRDIKKVVRNGP